MLFGSLAGVGLVRLLTKLPLPIKEPFPGFAVSMAVGFPTGNSNSRIGAGQVLRKRGRQVSVY